jgi:hypothetical protein
LAVNELARARAEVDLAASFVFGCPGPVSASSSTRCTLRAPACYWILSGRLEERSRSQMKINRSGHVPLDPLRETSVNRRLLQRSVGPVRAALSFSSPDGTDTCTYSSSRAL